MTIAAVLDVKTNEINQPSGCPKEYTYSVTLIDFAKTFVGIFSNRENPKYKRDVSNDMVLPFRDRQG